MCQKHREDSANDAEVRIYMQMRGITQIGAQFKPQFRISPDHVCLTVKVIFCHFESLKNRIETTNWQLLVAVNASVSDNTG